MQISNWMLLADAEAPATTTSTEVPAAPGAEGAQGGAAQPQDGGMFQMLLFLFVLFGIMWFLMIRPQQREQKRRQNMWDSIQKFDKVITIGGICGTVVGIDKEEGTLTLLVDESSNVKIRVLTSSVGEILPGKDGEKKDDAK